MVFLNSQNLVPSSLLAGIWDAPGTKTPSDVKPHRALGGEKSMSAVPRPEVPALHPPSPASRLR